MNNFLSQRPTQDRPPEIGEADVSVEVQFNATSASEGGIGMSACITLVIILAVVAVELDHDFVRVGPVARVDVHLDVTTIASIPGGN